MHICSKVFIEFVHLTFENTLVFVPRNQWIFNCIFSWTFLSFLFGKSWFYAHIFTLCFPGTASIYYFYWVWTWLQTYLICTIVQISADGELSHGLRVWPWSSRAVDHRYSVWRQKYEVGQSTLVKITRLHQSSITLRLVLGIHNVMIIWSSMQMKAQGDCRENNPPARQYK